MRVTNPRDKQHAFLGIEKDMRSNLEMDSSSIVLVKGGRLAYLAVGPLRRDSQFTFTGATALRKLAQAILREVPNPKPKKRGKAKR